jgi:hypothetical protein
VVERIHLSDRMKQTWVTMGSNAPYEKVRKSGDREPSKLVQKSTSRLVMFWLLFEHIVHVDTSFHDTPIIEVQVRFFAA